MLARFYNILSIFSIATVLAGGGFSVFLFGTGKLNSERVNRLGALLRGELDQSSPSETTMQPATEETPAAARTRSAEELHIARRQEQMQVQFVERATRDLEAQRRLLDQSLQYLLNEQEQFSRQQTQWTSEQQKATSKVQDEAARKQIELVAGLPPQQAKDHIVRLWNTRRSDAVALVMQLDLGKTKRILAQMKTPEEQKILSELLEQLRLQQPDGDARESGKTAGDAAP